MDGSGLAPCCPFDISTGEHSLFSPCGGGNIPRVGDAPVEAANFSNPAREAVLAKKAAALATLKKAGIKIIVAQPGQENNCDVACDIIQRGNYTCDKAGFLLAHTVSELRHAELVYKVADVAFVPDGVRFLGDFVDAHACEYSCLRALRMLGAKSNALPRS